MRYLFGFLCVCALGLMPMVGCTDDAGTGGSGGDGGSAGMGGSGGSNSAVFPCTEQGIRDAIAEGGGPHTFGCNGPQTVVTKAEILIDNDVILDGEGNLTVDGNDDHDVFAVAEGVTAELQGFAVTNGADDPSISGAGGIRIRANATLRLTNSIVSGNTGSGLGGGITNRGSLTLTDSAVSGNRGSGIFNVSGGTLTLTNSTVSGNTAIQKGGGIYNLRGGMLTLVNSTVSGNSAAAGGGGICNCGSLDPAGGTVTLVNSTVSGNSGGAGEDGILSEDGTVTVTNSLVDDACGGVITSNGYNIESPGDTCGFDQANDLFDVTPAELNLGPLQDNGGPTMTHALGEGSVAIDRIPEAMCEVDEDQRGVTRPQGSACDVGAFEVQGPIKSGLWLGGNPSSNTDGTPFDTGWAICFYVNDAGTALTASTDCDIDGDDDEPYLLEVSWKDDVGKDFEGEIGVCNGNPNPELDGIGIGTSFAQNVPIDNGSFQIEFGEGVVGWLITGTFNGDTATGTAMWEFSTGMSFGWCELVEEWTAAPVQ